MMKKYFLTGLVILLPIAVTAFVMFFLIDLLTAPFTGAVHKVLLILGQNVGFLQKYQGLLTFISRLIVLFFLFFVIIILGYLGSQIFRNFLQNSLDQLFLKIPFVKKIYKAVRDIVKTFFSNSKKAFEATVVVPFPSEKSFILGFQSGDAPREAMEKAHIDLSRYGYKSVFVPTSPHPVSGFLLIINQDDVKKVDISTEEAFKFLISAGLFKPEKPS